MDQDIYTEPISNNAPTGVLPVPARVAISRMRTVKVTLSALTASAVTDGPDARRETPSAEAGLTPPILPISL